MREIKFRAWDKYGNKMRLVKSVNYADDGFAKTILVHLVGGINGGYVHGESCELMQYTGLTDKNGKDVYEGDILTRVSPFSGETYFYKILWDGYNSRFIADGKRIRESVSGAIERGYEHAGNIYENPELLEGSA